MSWFSLDLRKNKYKLIKFNWINLILILFFSKFKSNQSDYDPVKVKIKLCIFF